MSAVSVNGLRKSYGDVEAVKGISFDVKEGSFFAFLGPNGAGKSTTISIMCSLLEHDSGEISVFGKAPVDARSEIGVVFQDHLLDPKLTVAENVRFRGEMYGLKGQQLRESADRVLALVNMTELADRPYGKLSGGQKRRADIARALVHGPKLLVLDEPTAGLDPQSRKSLWETVYRLNKETGLTVFLTTHYMEEAADADDIVIIKNGEIVAHGTSDSLKDEYCTDYIRIIPKDPGGFGTILESKGIGYTSDRDIFRVPVKDTMESLPILESLKEDISSFEVRKGTLDDAFIEITGGDGDE